MKKSDLKALINECIHEVLAEESADKKTKAIREAKRFLAENELTEADLLEGDFLKKIADIARQTFGVPRTSDKKTFDDAVAKLKAEGAIDDANIKAISDTAKSYAYIGQLEFVPKLKKWAFTGKSAAPATGMGGLQPGGAGSAE
jgi:hypothetical protein